MDNSFTFWDFGTWRVDRRNKELLGQNDQREGLDLKEFEVLDFLILQQGNFFLPAALVAEVWPNNFVEPNNAEQAISKIRRKLRNLGLKDKEIIEQHRGKGVRFLTPVIAPPELDSLSGKEKVEPMVWSTSGPPRPEGLWFDINAKKHRPMTKSIFLPISEEDLDTETGRLRRIEIPKAALAEAVMDRPDLLMDSQVYEYLRDVWSHPKKYHSIIAGHPALKTWIENIWAPLPRGAKGFERQQLQNFYRAMQSLDIPVQLLPDFTYEEVSCWRVFMQAFPESICLLEQASQIKEGIRDTQRMALASLSGTLAMTEDRRLSSRAAAIARRLNREVASSTVHSYEEYQIARHFLYMAVEAGESPVENFLDFLHNPHHPVAWEFRLNRGYYKDDTDASLALTIVRKLERPLNRDACTKKITEYHHDLLPKKLLDEAYKKMRQPNLLVAPRRR